MIRDWQIKVQGNQKNKAHCARCLGEFAAGELKLQSWRPDGKRNTDRRFHMSCVDSSLPEARLFHGFHELEQGKRCEMIEALKCLPRGMAGARPPVKVARVVEQVTAVPTSLPSPVSGGVDGEGDVVMKSSQDGGGLPSLAREGQFSQSRKTTMAYWTTFHH